MAVRFPVSYDASATHHVVSDVDRMSDAELIERVAARDRAAFDELYRRYARPMLGLALKRLGDRQQAEDASQDAFAAVWRSAASYDRRRGSAPPWLFTIARNAIVDGIRRRPEPTVGDAPEQRADGPGPAEHAERSWQAWRVHRALATLPEQERLVIELAYWGGLSQTEIAEFLHKPLGTVKTQTRTGLARLADILEEDLAP